MGGIIGALIAFGLLLIGVPIVGKIVGWEIGGLSAVLLIGFGGFSMLLGTIFTVVTKLYVKTKADEAFVRTGMNGMRIVKDGGALVVPVVHQYVVVPLRTFRLEVLRRGADALLTADKLRADIKAEFFVRVQPDDTDITNAARSLGDRTEHEATIRALIEDKLVSALRTVAATRSLEQLNSERDDFVRKVMESVTADLKHNGFTLETATISQLDQADAAALRDDNVFDAEGKLTIAKITQGKLTERNAIEQQKARERLGQNVEARQQMLALEQQQAQAEAEQQAKIAALQAGQQRAAKEAQIEAEQAIQEATLRRNQAVEVETQRVEQAKLVAAEHKQQAAEVAAQQRQQAAEVAERDRAIAVAKKEQEQAEAEAQRLAAEKARETEAQAVETVKVVQAAERAKEQQVIAASADAERQFLATQRAADAEAYQLTALAEGKKAAADADAEAVRKKAGAEAEAAKLRAAGAQAEAMVPVAVKRAEVEVEGQRVAVLQQELEARDRSGKSAQDFELAKLELEVRGSVQVEVAKAFAQFGHKIEAQVFGTPDDVARMANGLFAGMAGEKFAQGLLGNGNGNGHARGAIENIVSALGALGQKLGVDLGKFLAPSVPQAPTTGEAGDGNGATVLTAPEPSAPRKPRRPADPKLAPAAGVEDAQPNE